MDFRDSTYTEFDGDARWIKCFETFPQVNPFTQEEGWYIGKIHSHHNMSSVAHSGTDMSDLLENAPKLPMFLSVIVNYACAVEAKVAIATETEEVTYKSLKWQFKNLMNLGKRKKKVESKKEKTITSVILDCQIIYQQDDWFVHQVKHVQELQKQREEAARAKPYNHSSTHHQGGVDSYNRQFPQQQQHQLPYDSSKKESPHPEVIKHVSDLLTLGGDDKLIAFQALEWVNINTFEYSKENYKKALVAYFFNYWHPGTFYNNATITEEVAVHSLRIFFNYHERMWVNKTLNEALNDIKERIGEIREVQRPAMV